MPDIQPPPPVNANFTTAIFTRIGIDRYTVAESALGPVWVGWTSRGVSAVRRAGSAQAEAEFAHWYRERTGRRIVRAVEVDSIAHAAQAKLADAGAADVPLDLESTAAFERTVFAAVARIERGYARPCELLERELREPPGAHTVDAVLAANPVPLFIPCHRVIREDRCCGRDYVFGAQAQGLLLESEGLDPAAIDRVVQLGIRYIASGGWFCLPGCGDIACHVDEPGYEGLHSLSEAHARGLNACESCRPVAA